MAEQLVNWQEQFETGIEELDRQHRKLFEIINELHAGISIGKDKKTESFQQAAHKSVDYVKEHFAAEEKLMLEISYPGYAQQKEQHVFFIHQLLQDTDRFDAGDKFAPGRFLGFLTDWLLTHILELDTGIGQFVREQKEKNSWAAPSTAKS